MNSKSDKKDKIPRRRRWWRRRQGKENMTRKSLMTRKTTTTRQGLSRTYVQWDKSHFLHTEYLFVDGVTLSLLNRATLLLVHCVALLLVDRCALLLVNRVATLFLDRPALLLLHHVTFLLIHSLAFLLVLGPARGRGSSSVAPWRSHSATTPLLASPTLVVLRTPCHPDQRSDGVKAAEIWRAAWLPPRPCQAGEGDCHLKVKIKQDLWS